MNYDSTPITEALLKPDIQKPNVRLYLEFVELLLCALLGAGVSGHLVSQILTRCFSVRNGKLKFAKLKNSLIVSNEYTMATLRSYIYFLVVPDIPNTNQSTTLRTIISSINKSRLPDLQ